LRKRRIPIVAARRRRQRTSKKVRAFVIIFASWSKGIKFAGHGQEKARRLFKRVDGVVEVM